MNHHDISPDFKFDERSAKYAAKIVKHAETPKAITTFNKHKDKLDDYHYWFVLSTLWVSYTGFSDLRLWKRLFSSERTKKHTSLMKPSEVKALKQLPDIIPCLRAKRPNEEDWIAYTIDTETAAKMALKRGVDIVHEYLVKKEDVTALFLRRDEYELIVLDKSAPQFVRTIDVVVEDN